MFYHSEVLKVRCQMFFFDFISFFGFQKCPSFSTQAALGSDFSAGRRTNAELEQDKSPKALRESGRAGAVMDTAGWV